MKRLLVFIKIGAISLVMTAVPRAFAGVISQQALQLTRQDQTVLSASAYLPDSIDCRGIAIISPGAGGSENGYMYLGKAMASLGYISVVIGHQESGRSALRSRLQNKGVSDGLAELITDPDVYRARFLDITAAKSWAQNRCQSGEAILIGHSMGAATILMEAGANNKLGVQGKNSFDIYIALSPQGVGWGFPENAWTGIRKPVLMLTGTRDTEFGGASWETRKEPFANMPPGCKWLGVVDGATHLNFAGVGLSGNTEALTTKIISAFLESIHRQDCKAPEPLRGLNLSTK